VRDGNSSGAQRGIPRAIDTAVVERLHAASSRTQSLGAQRPACRCNSGHKSLNIPLPAIRLVAGYGNEFETCRSRKRISHIHRNTYWHQHVVRRPAHIRACAPRYCGRCVVDVSSTHGRGSRISREVSARAGLVCSFARKNSWSGRTASREPRESISASIRSLNSPATWLKSVCDRLPPRVALKQSRNCLGATTVPCLEK
jgi:hypothetical protein